MITPQSDPMAGSPQKTFERTWNPIVVIIMRAENALY